ncbi:uncharacterized protein LOC131153227 [Malania oleifera]|uniref:uncharacterized protein LOC131153227 n=1 Tax=Malania oleifera TaxID=397392 RepID=UPI0025ADC548|nr:uncharacterized protein LOC131153227 [Malania oleifera]
MATQNVTTPSNPPTLLATIDMGTNSFKMVIVRAHPTGKFLVVDRLKEPVVLGRDMPTFTGAPAAPAAISSSSQSRALQALSEFQQILNAHKVDHTRLVATSAVRDAGNRAEFLRRIRDELGFEVDILSGEEEGRLVYLGVLQFLPVFHKSVLIVDIGGGSTEFVIGKEGKVVYVKSLKLGHVCLTEGFLKKDGILEFESRRGLGNHEISELGRVYLSESEPGSLSKGVLENDGISKSGDAEIDGISRMRRHIRMVIQESGLIEKVKEVGFEMAIGSSGTVRAIEKASFSGYARGMADDFLLFGEFKRDWKFTRGELESLVQRLCNGGGEEKVRREGFFKRRSEFIVAGAVLLEEIFEMLDIEEMEVSGYALGEGIIAESLALVCDNYDLNANARWHSVVSLATRFNGKKRMKVAASCAGIAKEIFEGLRTHYVVVENKDKLTVSIDDQDLEYLEAACLLHNIGLFAGRKGYHKQSYHLIMNGDHLYGYSADEVKLIALLVRHHRKKFPKFDHSSLKGFPKEVKQKFRILCAIIRISVILQQYECANLEEMGFSISPDGLNLVFNKVKDRPVMPGLVQALADDFEAERRQELEHFKMVSQQELLVVVPSSPPE